MRALGLGPQAVSSPSPVQRTHQERKMNDYNTSPNEVSHKK